MFDDNNHCVLFICPPLKPSLFLKPLKAGSLEGALEPRGGREGGKGGKSGAYHLSLNLCLY